MTMSNMNFNNNNNMANMSNNNMSSNNSSNNPTNFCSPEQNNNGNFSTSFNADYIMKSCASYENFRIKYSQFYNLNANHMHIITPEHGQGILLHHDVGSQQAQVLLNNGEYLTLPASQLSLHIQHRVPTFEEFMAEQMSMNGGGSFGGNAGNAGGNGNGQPSLKRGRDEIGEMFASQMCGG